MQWVCAPGCRRRCGRDVGALGGRVLPSRRSPASVGGGDLHGQGGRERGLVELEAGKGLVALVDVDRAGVCVVVEAYQGLPSGGNCAGGLGGGELRVRALVA